MRKKMHNQKKMIEGHEYIVYGASADLINWVESSQLADQSLGAAKVSIDDLFRAFGSKTDAGRVDFSKQVIKKLWYSRPILGPYPFLDTLSTFEFDRLFYPHYRDHVCHQLKVYLLGLFAYENCPKIRDEIDRSLNIPGSESEPEMLLRWLAAAVYHDVGYVLENDQALEPRGNAWQTTRDKLNQVLEAPLSTMPPYSQFMTRDVELRLIQDYKIFTPRVSYPKDIEYYNKIDLLDQFNAEALRAGLATNGSPLRMYYDYAKNHETLEGGRGRFRDHGIVSSLLLLYTWRAFADYVAMLSSKAGGDTLIQQNFTLIDELARKLAAHSESIRASASAIALHNISGNIWERGDALSHGLTFHRFQMCLSEEGQQTPLAFLLGLVDTLQDWDRPRFRPIRNGDRPLLIDQDISITNAEGRLLIYMPADAKKFKDPPSTPDSLFSKATSAMKAFLQKDEIDSLIGWTNNPQKTLMVSKSSRPSTDSIGAEVSRVQAILDNLPQAFQSYGKSNLFEAGRALLLEAKQRVVLVAKTPIPIVGARPYDDSSTSPYYEREQYDAYIDVIRRTAVDREFRFLCIASVPALRDDIANVAANHRSEFCRRIEGNMRRFIISQEQDRSRCELRWTDERTPMTFLIVDENFMMWWKDEKGDSVFLTARSQLLADALAHQARLLSKSLTNAHVFSIVEAITSKDPNMSSQLG